MNEEEIRSVIRDVLAARDERVRSAGPRSGGASAFAKAPADRISVSGGWSAPQTHHPSFVRLSMVVPTEVGSPCVIEPNVGCNQCGYCVSLGH